MDLLLAFAVTLLAAVLISDLADRTVLSTAVLFLVVGFVLGSGVLGILPENPNDPLVKTLPELALFAILFTDGMRVGLRDLSSAWRLPGRALFFGLPLTMILTAGMAHLLTDLTWVEALLLGAVLSPTDPVFAAAIVGREGVPYRLRHLLNVESGLNDGLALPVVLILIDVVSEDPIQLGSVLLELLAGIALGIAIPYVFIKLEETRFLSASKGYQPLHALALGLVILAITLITGANEFLAAFAGGMTVATISSAVREDFQQFGELVAEILKLVSIMVFGALISTEVLVADVGWTGWIFAFLVIFAARPIAILLSLLGSRLDRREWAAAAWFGPKGFASLVYALLVFHTPSSQSSLMFHLSALAIGLSILLHSSTDVVTAKWLMKHVKDGDAAGS